MSYRLKARAPLGAYGVSPMPTVGMSKAYGRPGRGGPAAAVAISACALLLMVALGAWAIRRQAATAAHAAAALAQLRDQQAEIDGLTRQLAALRGANDQVRAELAKLAAERAEPKPQARADTAAAAAPVMPVATRAPAALPLAIASPPAPAHADTDAVAAAPPRRQVAHRPARHRRHVRTVVVNGITYVQGREPHALGLPLE